MIEIKHTIQKKNDKQKIKFSKKSNSVKKTKKSFSTEFENAIVNGFEGTFEELVDDLKEQEKKFIDNQNNIELLKYKSLVKEILTIIVNEGFKTKNIKRIKKDRADFTIISEIDHKLLEISNSISKSNKAFNLLKTIEEIRGLIFDLVF